MYDLWSRWPRYSLITLEKQKMYYLQHESILGLELANEI